MDIGSIQANALQQTGALKRLDQIAQNLNALTKGSAKPDSGTPDAAKPWADPKQTIPSIHQILPSLLKQLAEITDEKSQFASVLADGSSSLPKNPTELSPLAFLEKEERKELQELLGALLNNNSSKDSKATPQAASPADTSSSAQWALFSALKKVDTIISKGEDRLHESVAAQLTPTQEVLGHFLSDSEQNEAIALLGQKSLLTKKAEGNPLSAPEQSQLAAIDNRITALFDTAENTLQSAGVDVAALKSAITSETPPDIAAIIGKENPNNTVQKDLVAILQDTDATESPNTKDNYALNALSGQQQTVLAMMPPAGFTQVQQKLEQLGHLSAKTTLTGNEAKKTIDLTKQTTELLQGYESSLKAQGVNVTKVTALLSSDQPVKTQDLEAAFGIAENTEPSTAQQKSIDQIVASFFASDSNAPKGETSLATAGVAAAKRKVEYPAPLTPLEAIQKRIEGAKNEMLKATARKESAAMREKMIAPVRNIQEEIQVSGAQPAAQPVEAQNSAAQLSAAGFGSVISGRSS